ncbi:MAG TPA: vitamin K epoxide reductase family protein [Candidatus Saccharimonadales bacterium]|nr:vitamin K epoxide reductase family protein [Candidatus Saccharimonadales bacterium]
MIKQRTIYGLITAGGVAGLTASFLETLEYQEILKNSHAQLVCNLNSVFSCGNVLNSWQSKIFGFPNSMLCMVFFTLMLSSGVVGLTGGILAPKFRLWLHGIATFFLGFALWFMWESTFRVRALCILCVFCFAGLLTINWGWLRTNAEILPIGEQGRKRLYKAIHQGADTFAWVVLALLIAFVMLLKFSK